MKKSFWGIIFGIIKHAREAAKADLRFEDFKVENKIYTKQIEWSFGILAAKIQRVLMGLQEVGHAVVEEGLVPRAIHQIKISKNLNMEEYPVATKLEAEESYVQIYFYRKKFPYLKEVIRMREGRKYDKEIVVAWMSGKIFGYDNKLIDEFIKKGYAFVPIMYGSKMPMKERRKYLKKFKNRWRKYMRREVQREYICWRF